MRRAEFSTVPLDFAGSWPRREYPWQCGGMWRCSHSGVWIVYAATDVLATWVQVTQGKLNIGYRTVSRRVESSLRGDPRPCRAKQGPERGVPSAIEIYG